ncbi:MAG: AAA family ATPase [Nitrospirae bacterium]|nr:MAG: AAA family ATPase [Nitrospirota bacterium]
MTYLEFFNLKEHPFSNVVDNRFYYNSEQHSKALEKLKFMIDRGQGLGVVIGSIGTGKTTLARRLLDELDEDRYEATLLVVIHSSVSSDWLLKKFAIQLGIEEPKDSRLEILGQIYQRLTEIKEQGKRTVLLIDEVQMLNSRELMEEFRGLLNMESPDGKLINFIFFGLPELEHVLSLDEPLKQRVAMRIVLKPLPPEHTYNYIRHRLHVAGSNEEIFTNDAMQKVYEYSQGIPRLINTICDNAMLEAFLRKSKTITPEIIDTVAVDLGLKMAAK